MSTTTHKSLLKSFLEEKIKINKEKENLKRKKDEKEDVEDVEDKNDENQKKKKKIESDFLTEGKFNEELIES
jgi:exopolysaccharide biosynthesis protein